jgi:hypothetical protein
VLINHKISLRIVLYKLRYMFLENNKILKGQIVLIDPYIHKKAKLSSDVFLERVENIRYLRTSINYNYISFFITSIEEYNNLIKFHDLVNKGVFDFENHAVFAVAIQPKLYDWFKTTHISVIQKQIACWMAGSYFFNPEKRRIQKEQVYKPLLEIIYDIVETYYQTFKLPDFNDLRNNLSKKNDETYFDEKEKCIEKYQQVSEIYCGVKQPEFLKSPFDYEMTNEWGVNEYHNFVFVQAYLNENDWNRIILNGNNNDDMHRVESLDDLWLKWKHVYTTFNQRKSFVYSFFFDPLESTNKYVKTKRGKVSNVIRNQVWERDKGKCVECGSNLNLEFDHIIPISMGGASTYRNLQLLCEPCNRKKSNKI